MPMNTNDGYSYEVDKEDLFTDMNQWNEELAGILAELIDITLPEKHLKILRFMREDTVTNGVPPTLRGMQTAGGFPVKDLFQLFLGKPAKKMAYLAGFRKPVGCV